ncbi:phospholipase D family protein [Corallococcus sp. AB038B]|uniref:phospholipase D family protein n=1 Tax=Corallococcus sp. AB038B TaxID=2316718 RepID=UPI0011C443D4|nr:phospholipase D family protein [Corallococcus sp. AB038B]
MAENFTVLASTADTMDALRRLVAWASDIDLVYAWASSAGGTAEHWKCLPLERVRRAVIGIHFAQTEPQVLVELGNAKVLRVIEDTSGVFHPKLLVGRRGGQVRALWGSSNFTRGGFHGNTELNVLFEGDAQCNAAGTLLSFVDAAWHDPRAFTPSAAWLAAYHELYESRPKPPIKKAPQPLPANAAVCLGDLSCDWAGYYALIARQERRALANGFEIRVFDHPDGSYLGEAEACREAFHRWPAFASMPEDERKLVAGWGRDTTGYFGRMQGAGYFKQLTTDSPKQLGRFLDAVPVRGRVSHDVVEAYLDGVLALRGVGLGAATRLLAMKRPDVFLSVNNANRRRLWQVFGTVPTSATTYVKFLDTLWSFPWFAASRPLVPVEARVWRCRIALLDTLLYEL